MRRRRFTQDFKRILVEQLFSETAGTAALCPRYNISSNQPYTWKGWEKEFKKSRMQHPSKNSKKEISLHQKASSSKKLKRGVNS